MFDSRKSGHNNEVSLLTECLLGRVSHYYIFIDVRNFTHMIKLQHFRRLVDVFSDFPSFGVCK